MKKDLLYNFLLISLIIHLLFVLPGFADFGRPKNLVKEPLLVEIRGPVYAAPKSLPQLARKEEPRPLAAKPQEPVKEVETEALSPSTGLTVPVPDNAKPVQQYPTPPVPSTDGRAEGGINGSSPADKQGISGCTRYLAKQNQADLFIISYLTRLSSMMDRRVDSLLEYSGPEVIDPSVEFTVKSGELDSIVIVRSSGNADLDNALKQVLKEASPFVPLPDAWRDQDITFVATINIY